MITSFTGDARGLAKKSESPLRVYCGLLDAFFSS